MCTTIWEILMRYSLTQYRCGLFLNTPSNLWPSYTPDIRVHTPLPSVYRCIPLYISVYLCISLYTSVYLCKPLYTSVNLCIPLYTAVYFCVLLPTGYRAGIPAAFCHRQPSNSSLQHTGKTQSVCVYRTAASSILVRLSLSVYIEQQPPAYW